MKITGLQVYQVDLPLHEGNYSWSKGNSVDVFDLTVVDFNSYVTTSIADGAPQRITMVACRHPRTRTRDYPKVRRAR